MIGFSDPDATKAPTSSAPAAPAPSVEERALERRKRIALKLGELFDLADPPERARSAEEREERPKRRRAFQCSGVELLREVVRAAVEHPHSGRGRERARRRPPTPKRAT